jgi:opacity protein-like surface antigen
MSPKDVIQKLDFALMGMFEARNGRWGLLADAFYAKLSDGADNTFSLRGRSGFDVNVDLNMKQHIYALAGEYRVLQGTTPVDLMLGARYNDIQMHPKVDVQGLGPLGLSRTRTFSYDKNWVDPYVGLRFVHRLADKWSLLGYGDVGGAGIGAASKFTYQLMGGLIYDYSRTVSFKAGYRQYHINYDHGGFAYDVNQRGFIAALGVKF